jgi:RNA repair pathway DNA polymerase beta family
MPNTRNLKTIVKAVAGSHLFGLNTPTSDQDFKGVFQANLDAIILGVDSKNIQVSTNKTDSRNTQDDVDTELKELRTFIKDCMKGQTYALELLYTPQDKILESSPSWEFIQANRKKLQPNDLAPFIGYAFGQSAKYSLRGVRLEELERVIAWFQIQDENVMLGDVIASLEQTKYTYTEIYEHKNKNAGHPDEQRLSCLGVIFQYNKPIKECLPTLIKRLNQYGERSKNNKEDGGVDWKAYSHAFRLIYEWEQLLLEGRLTFPVPNRDYILSVKKGEISFEEVQEKLYEEFDRIQQIPNNLPEPDKKFWDNWILEQYKV